MPVILDSKKKIEIDADRLVIDSFNVSDLDGFVDISFSYRDSLDNILTQESLRVSGPAFNDFLGRAEQHNQAGESAKDSFKHSLYEDVMKHENVKGDIQ